MIYFYLTTLKKMTLAIGAIVLLTASGAMGFEAKAVDCEKWNICQLACDAGGPAKNACRVGCNKKNTWVCS